MSEISVGFFGPAKVGKSALIIRLVNGSFVDFYDPTIEDAYRIARAIDGVQCVFSILDTAGDDDYSALRDFYITKTSIFVVVYSVADRGSFDEMRSTIHHIRDLRKNDDPIILVGNKCDLEDERRVSTEEGRVLADEFGVSFIETSAKDNKNVEEIVQVVAGIACSNNNSNSNSNVEDKKKCVIR